MQQDARSPLAHLGGALGFGKYMTNAMVLCRYSDGTGWEKPSLVPYGTLAFDPCALVLHYGQAIYEGMNAYRSPDASIALFRPDRNAARFRASARRMEMAEMPEGLFIEAVSTLVDAQRDWVPAGAESSLYLRPVMVADEAAFGVRRSTTYLFFIVATPVDALYRDGMAPFRLMVSEDFARAAPGGGGDAKTSGNYGRTLIALEAARRSGFNNVLWLDPVEREFIEEAGITNVFVRRGRDLLTPPLNGRILPGVMRETILQLARDWGLSAIEREISVTELLSGIDAGDVDEVFLSGTAVHVAPVGVIARRGREHRLAAAGEAQSLAKRLSQAISEIQRGLVADTRGWMRRVAAPSDCLVLSEP